MKGALFSSMIGNGNGNGNGNGSGSLSVSSSSERLEANDTEGGKPKLKALHWDKVRATSDRATVWDQIKSSSFQ